MGHQVNTAGQMVMWSIGQIAERDRVSKPAVSKMVAKLIRQHELPVEKDSRGRVAKVSLAHYDHHRKFFGSSEQDQTGREPEPEIGPKSNQDSRDEALRQKAWLELGRQRLEHAEQVGQLVRRDRLEDAVRAIGRTMQSEIGRLPNRADELALAVSKEGSSGVRLALRQIALDLNNRIADALAEIAERAPETDEPLSSGSGPDQPLEDLEQ